MIQKTKVQICPLQFYNIILYLRILHYVTETTEFKFPEYTKVSLKNEAVKQSPHISSVRAKDYKSGTTCYHCGEDFKTFYDDEKDEWLLADASPDPNNRLMHSNCWNELHHTNVYSTT